MAMKAGMGVTHDVVVINGIHGELRCDTDFAPIRDSGKTRLNLRLPPDAIPAVNSPDSYTVHFRDGTYIFSGTGFSSSRHPPFYLARLTVDPREANRISGFVMMPGLGDNL